jgi:hypothetical protein
MTELTGRRAIHRASPTAPRSHRASTRPGGFSHGIAIGIALAIALAAVAIAYQSFMQASRSQSQLTIMQSRLTAMQQQLGAAASGVALEREHVRSVAAKAIGVQRSLNHVNWELASVPTESELARVRGQLSAYAACMPQMRRELEGLGINWKIDPAKPTADYFKLVTVAPMSTSCSTLLSGR